MKSKTKPKTNTHTNPEHHTGTPHPNPHTTTSTHPNPAHQPTTFGSPTHEHGAHESLKTKTCEEMETGGFGSFDETMATSNRCTERATEFCNSCGKTLCGVHYDALHRGRELQRPEHWSRTDSPLDHRTDQESHSPFSFSIFRRISVNHDTHVPFKTRMSFSIRPSWSLSIATCLAHPSSRKGRRAWSR